MSESVTGAPVPTGWRGLVARVALAGLRVSLKVSPRPMVWVIRRQFAGTGVQLAASLSAQAPADVSVVGNERYAEQRDAVCDVYSPAGAGSDGSRLPMVVWTHGGAFVGGSKDEIGGYLRMIAAAGFVVVGLNYTLAPDATYPTPVRQVMAALRHLRANADRLHADPDRLLLAGDSAGAEITAQVAAIAGDPGYGERVGVESTITPDHLRGVALFCGIYDVSLVDQSSPLKNFVHAVAWAYSGTHDYQHDDHFMSTMTVTGQVTEAFPPAFITAGNADPLVTHSHALAAALESKGVEVEAFFFPADHQPPLPHEYQFDLGLDDARAALRRLIAFFHGCTDTT